MATRTIERRLLGLGLCATLGIATLGCGPQFDPPSKLQTLRVLAVKKDDPYLRPHASPPAADDPNAGSEPDNVAHMTLAFEDGRRAEDKLGPLQKLWVAGCNNPIRDNYFGCLLSVWLSFKAFSELGPGKLQDGQSWSVANLSLADYSRVQSFLEEVFPGYSASDSGSDLQGPNGETINTDDLIEQAMAIRVGAGDEFDYAVPSWIIDKHAPPAQPTLPRYGLSQVFLAVCDGEIGLSPNWLDNVDALAVLTDATRGFPLTCYDPVTREERGPDNFMVSYSNLYVYDSLTNHNPVIRGLSFDGQPIDGSSICIGEACVGASDPNCDGSVPVRRVKLCPPNAPSGCKEYDITPILEASENSEFDDIASRVGGGNAQLYEQMWIRYYADQGKIARDTKRLQDANEGWFPEHKTKWTVPSRGEGVAHIWSVVYDNHGGVDWVRASVCLEP